ncbi:hypothetical protein ACHAWF_009699 [Thalassiosira exigua]
MLTGVIYIGVVLFATTALALDHDGWEFYGGQKRRQKHGLNRATADAAPRDNGGIRFDKAAPGADPDLLITNDEAPAAPVISPNSRGVSTGRARAKKELLMLPNQHSVLNFGEKNENKPVESAWWGRLYVDGFPNSFQYFRAHFGSPPSNKPVQLVLADPLNMCEFGEPVLNWPAVASGHSKVLVVARGGCTFGEKARKARENDFGGILFVNNVEGLFHPSGPDGDSFVSASMITQHDGFQLMQALRRAAETGRELKARFVPIWCEHSSRSRSYARPSSYCRPVYKNDENFELSRDYSGTLRTDDGVDLDYVQAEFGSYMDQMGEWSIETPSPRIDGGDAYCCDEHSFQEANLDNTTALLCLRGECDFATKAENAAAAGAGLVAILSNNNTLIRLGCDPPIRGRKLNLPVVMVSYDASKRVKSGSKISVSQQNNVLEQSDEGMKSCLMNLSHEFCVDP